MSWEVHIEWKGAAHFVGRLHAAEHGSAVSFEYASNYDDHLRNHGFLMREPGRWSLSPAYDINPVPEVDRARLNKMPISEDREELSIEGALVVAPRFGLKEFEAKKILSQALTAISTWKKTGRKLRLKAATLDTYSSAFEHRLVGEARQVLNG